MATVLAVDENRCGLPAVAVVVDDSEEDLEWADLEDEQDEDSFSLDVGEFMQEHRAGDGASGDD